MSIFVELTIYYAFRLIRRYMGVSQNGARHQQKHMHMYTHTGVDRMWKLCKSI